MDLNSIKSICLSEYKRIPIEYRLLKSKAKEFIDFIIKEKLEVRNKYVPVLMSWIKDDKQTNNFSEVKSIKYVGLKKTYDLHIKSGNSYVASGIVCHNTINLPEKTTQEEVSEIYKYAYEKGLKGVTIYRDGSKRNQPVSLSVNKKEQKTFTRPSRMKADSFRLDTGNGHLYVNVSTDGGKPLEVFLQLGKSGQMLNTFAEALGRVISISLQSGVPVDNLTETLLGINSDRTAWIKLEETDKKPVQILSIPDALAKLLNRFYSGKEFNLMDVGEPCPICKIGRMVMIEGCSSCVDCGYSKCS